MACSNNSNNLICTLKKLRDQMESVRKFQRSVDQHCAILWQRFFRKSMIEMKLPSEWKQASKPNITPLSKGGTRTKLGDYLTSVPGKVMERIEQVRAHLKLVGILNSCQHGFVTGRSCPKNLLVSLEEWDEALDEGRLVDFLQDRQMLVGIHGEFSDWTDVTSSVLQGTIKEPTQFGLYVNDIQSLSSIESYSLQMIQIFGE